MVFAKELFSEDIQKQLDPEMGCSYDTWQKIVLQSCLMIHAVNKHKTHTKTDHVIRIPILWACLRHELRLRGIEFVSKDPDEDAGSGLETSVLEYVEDLAYRGYAVSLNTRMGHAYEYSFRLTDAFFEHIQL